MGDIAGVPTIPQRREGASRYVHAKVVWFASEQEELRISGSANPSVAAFFAAPHARNAQAAVPPRARPRRSRRTMTDA